MRRFDNRAVIVTGAASGIGAACVRRLLDEGASVVAADVQRERLAEQYAADADRVWPVAVDITDRADVERLIGSALERFGSLHGLVNSAGIRGVGSILDVDLDAWRRVIAVNLEGTFLVCQAFARAVVEAGTPAAIVNVSSSAGIRGVPNRLPYSASKFGVVGLTKTMAMELGPKGVRVNAVVPGMIHTPMTQPMFDDPANVQRIRADHPIGREGRPEDVAAAIAFLLSDDAAFITGVALPVDGGKTAGSPSR